MKALLILQLLRAAGQSFRWRQTADNPLEFTGVIGQRAVRGSPLLAAC
jgi:hypothetical protein